MKSLTSPCKRTVYGFLSSGIFFNFHWSIVRTPLAWLKTAWVGQLIHLSLAAWKGSFRGCEVFFPSKWWVSKAIWRKGPWREHFASVVKVAHNVGTAKRTEVFVDGHGRWRHACNKMGPQYVQLLWLLDYVVNRNLTFSITFVSIY